MRKRLTVAALMAALLLIVVVTTGAAKKAPEIVPPKGCPGWTKAAEFRPFAKKVWDLDRWKRGQPAKKAVRAMKERQRCAASPSHRRAMKRSWQKAKVAYYGHRGEERAAARKRREQARYEEAVTPPGLSVLEAIAACESGGDPTAVSPDGSYRGKYQFDYRTWESVGGSGDPAAAPEKEQDERAAALYNERGSSPWPVCG